MANEEGIMRFQRVVVSEYSNSRSGRMAESGGQEDKKVFEIGVVDSYVKLSSHFACFETVNSKIPGPFLMWEDCYFQMSPSYSMCLRFSFSESGI